MFNDQVLGRDYVVHVRRYVAHVILAVAESESLEFNHLYPSVAQILGRIV